MVTQSLISLLVVAFVVFRFAQRELKPRVVKAATLWIRPVVLIAIAGWLIALTLMLDPSGTTEMIVALGVGIVLGIVTGALIVANTAFSPADISNAVRAQGSRFTFAIWIGAFAIRFAARYIVPHGTDPRTQLPLNAGTVALVAAAFVVIAVGFYRAMGVVRIRRPA
ncbi:MAG TPA: hypothetical protein VIW69_19150 [Candidatus Elarobacter sp.]